MFLIFRLRSEPIKFGEMNKNIIKRVTLKYLTHSNAVWQYFTHFRHSLIQLDTVKHILILIFKNLPNLIKKILISIFIYFHKVW